MIETITVKRKATVDKKTAVASVRAKYPDYQLVALRLVRESAVGGDSDYWTATLHKKAEFPPTAEESKDEAAEETPAPAEDKEPKDEKGDDYASKDKDDDEADLDVDEKILHMVKEILHAVKPPEPGPEEGLDAGLGAGDMQGPEDAEDPRGPLPPPIPQPSSVGGGGLGPQKPVFTKRNEVRVVREDGNFVLMKDAKAELDSEFGPRGYRVTAMQRFRDRNVIVATLKKK